jgi:two-component system capsular synthesis response regulator RcsB
MIISCADRSPIGLWDLKDRVKAVRPDATINGYRDPEEALLHAKEEGCDVLLTEIDLGGSQREGLDFALRMQAIHPAVNIIFVTTFEESDFARDVIQMRVSGFVRKPFKQQQLEEEFSKLRYAVK